MGTPLVPTSKVFFLLVAGTQKTCRVLERFFSNNYQIKNGKSKNFSKFFKDENHHDDQQNEQSNYGDEYEVHDEMNDENHAETA